MEGIFEDEQPTEPRPFCCNQDCRQGRDCPARQACALPEDGEPRRQLLPEGWFIGALLALAIVAVALLAHWAAR